MSRRWIFRLVVAALVVAFFVFRDELPEFNLEEIIKDLSEGLGAWTYLLVALLAFLETGAFVGLVAPGEFTVLLGGAVAGQGDISLPLILAITWLSAFLGDTVSFMLGAKLGRGFLVKHGEKVRITEERLHQVEAYFDRHGGKTILIGRFIGLVRALAPFIAGTSKMPYRAFWPYSVLGTGLWATTFILIGYFASQSLDTVADIVSRGLIGFGVFVGVVVAIVVSVRYLRVPANRRHLAAEMEKRALLRPLLALGRRLEPQARFFWERLTPGGIGLEFTTLMAVLSVGLFVLIAFWSIVAGDPGPTPGDQTAYDVANDIRAADGSTTCARGSPSSARCSWSGRSRSPRRLCSASKRRWAELAVLVAGMAVIIVLSDAIKDWTDRPRPPDGLVETSGSSFPSKHAAYATIYTWLAVTVAFRTDPGITRRSLLIVGRAGGHRADRAHARLPARALAQRRHLGMGARASRRSPAAAAIALVVTHFRDNPRPDDRTAERGPGAPAGAGN